MKKSSKLLSSLLVVAPLTVLPITVSCSGGEQKLDDPQPPVDKPEHPQPPVDKPEQPQPPVDKPEQPQPPINGGGTSGDNIGQPQQPQPPIDGPEKPNVSIKDVKFTGLKDSYFEDEEIRLTVNSVIMSDSSTPLPNDIKYQWYLSNNDGTNPKLIGEGSEFSSPATMDYNGKRIQVKAIYKDNSKSSDSQIINVEKPIIEGVEIKGSNHYQENESANFEAKVKMLKDAPVPKTVEYKWIFEGQYGGNLLSTGPTCNISQLSIEKHNGKKLVLFAFYNGKKVQSKIITLSIVPNSKSMKGVERINNLPKGKKFVISKNKYLRRMR